MGNIAIWYSTTVGIITYCGLLVFYLLRRRRLCYDLNVKQWEQFQSIGIVLLSGYLFNYLPYFFVEKSLFLHHYLPAFVFKVLVTATLIEHIYVIFKDVLRLRSLTYLYLLLIIIWLGFIFYVFKKFAILSYGIDDLKTSDIKNFRWKDSWDFIVHKN